MSKQWEVDVAHRYTVKSKSLWRALLAAGWLYILWKLGKVEEPPKQPLNGTTKQ